MSLGLDDDPAGHRPLAAEPRPFCHADGADVLGLGGELDCGRLEFGESELCEELDGGRRYASAARPGSHPVANRPATFVTALLADRDGAKDLIGVDIGDDQSELRCLN